MARVARRRCRTGSRQLPDRGDGRGHPRRAGRPGRRAARAAHGRQRRASSTPRPSRLARCCHRMAERFARGGRLVALGHSAGRALRRPPRRGRVRPSGDRRQARAARDRARRRGRVAAGAGRGGRRARRHRGRLRGRRAGRRRDGRGAGRGPGARLPDDRLRALRRRVGVRARGRRPVRAPGAGRDALPRALGAGPCLLRPPRPARGPRGARRSTTPAPRASSTRSSPRPRPTSTRSSTTSGSRC